MLINLIQYSIRRLTKNIIRNVDRKIVVELKKDCFYDMSNNNSSLNGHGSGPFIFINLTIRKTKNDAIIISVYLTKLKYFINL